MDKVVCSKSAWMKRWNALATYRLNSSRIAKLSSMEPIKLQSKTS